MDEHDKTGAAPAGAACEGDAAALLAERDALERELERVRAGRRVVALEFRARDLAPLLATRARLMREAIREGVREAPPVPTVFVEDRKARAARERAAHLRGREADAQARVDALRARIASLPAPATPAGRRREVDAIDPLHAALGVAVRELGDARRAREEADAREARTLLACNARREVEAPRMSDEEFREGRAVREVREARPDLPREVARALVRGNK
jgi:hypothetical protein